MTLSSTPLPRKRKYVEFELSPQHSTSTAPLRIHPATIEEFDELGLDHMTQADVDKVERHKKPFARLEKRIKVEEKDRALADEKKYGEAKDESEEEERRLSYKCKELENCLLRVLLEGLVQAADEMANAKPAPTATSLANYAKWRSLREHLELAGILVT